MNEILNQLGGLVLGSVPTMIFFVLLVVAYGLLVRGPLDRVLAERRKRTSGAVEQARSALMQAENETTLFEERMRAARAELMQARELRMKQWAAEREQALGEARAATQARVLAAKLAIEQGAEAARQQIESMSGELSAQILRAVLPRGAAGSEAAQ